MYEASEEISKRRYLKKPPQDPRTLLVIPSYVVFYQHTPPPSPPPSQTLGLASCSYITSTSTWDRQVPRLCTIYKGNYRGHDKFRVIYAEDFLLLVRRKQYTEM